LRSAFSEGREFLRELSAQNNSHIIDHFTEPIIKDQNNSNVDISAQKVETQKKGIFTSSGVSHAIMNIRE
jgi:HKD family nuclease